MPFTFLRILTKWIKIFIIKVENIVRRETSWQIL